MPRARRATAEPEGPSKAWMESYADAMTLLLAFFIMMYAFALVDTEKFNDFKVGMVQALGISNPITDEASGILEGGDGIAEVPGTMAVPSQQAQELLQSQATELGRGELGAEDAEALRATLEASLDAVGAGDHVSVDLDERGVVMRFDARVLFASGRAGLVAGGGVILGQVGSVLTGIDNAIVVEGHTDNVPIRDGGQWPTNWELSTARASTVVRYFIEQTDLPGARLAAAGFADTRPRASNGTAEGRQQNRRVEVLVVIAGMTGGTGAATNPAEPSIGTTIDPGISTGISPAPASPLLQN